MHMDRITADIVTKVIGFAMAHARLDTAPGRPSRKTPGMVVAAVVARSQFALTVSRAAKFPAPQNQRLIEQSAQPQVLNQRRTRLIRLLALAADRPR